ncbi:glycosyltransferase family 4 protein [Bacillus marasmi]|uniref:glycosyltransferase family 4 protein n=1 Tax=Bacillus marasmi TaxID=1926279 RepID=UPI0011CB31FE|nr:glycosyltransferase family 4 protein [Bacillus marasmi]
MRIVLITLTNAPGIIRYSINIANQFAKNGHNVSFVCSKYFESNIINENIDVIKTFDTKRPRIEKSTFDYKKLLQVVNTIKKIDPEVVHFMSPHPLNIPLSFLLKKYNNVMTVHDPEPHPGEKITKVHYYYNKIATRYLADKIVIHGKSHNNALKKMKVDKKAKYIKMGIEPANEVITVLPREKTVLFFGRIQPYKGLDLFIKSAILLEEKRKDIKFIIAGDGNIEEYSELLGRINNLEIHNYLIPEQEIENLFKKSSIVVLPYTSASQSGIIPIAYYYSRPVIVTNVGALPEYVENYSTGLIVENVDEESVSKAIMDLLLDENELLRMSKKSFEKLRDDLSIDVMCKALINYYSL